MRHIILGILASGTVLIMWLILSTLFGLSWGYEIPDMDGIGGKILFIAIALIATGLLLLGITVAIK